MEYLHTIICRVLATTENVHGRCMLVDCEVLKSNKYKYIIVSLPKAFGKKVIVAFCERVCNWVTATYNLDTVNGGDRFVVQFKLRGK